jgi:hypothetical protein
VKKGNGGRRTGKKHRQGKKDRQYIVVMIEEQEESEEGRTERKISLGRRRKDREQVS